MYLKEKIIVMMKQICVLLKGEVIKIHTWIHVTIYTYIQKLVKSEESIDCTNVSFLVLTIVISYVKCYH